jgi:hypothetical protein
MSNDNDGTGLAGGGWCSAPRCRGAKAVKSALARSRPGLACVVALAVLHTLAYGFVCIIAAIKALQPLEPRI